MYDKDLWSSALLLLNEEERALTTSQNHNKLSVIADLLETVKKTEGICIKKQWRYRRKNGEVVIFRDVVGKIAKWVHRFKEIGDIATQYDPVHAALPWAGVRFLIEIAIGDIEKFPFMVEGAERIGYLIDRCTLVEEIYLASTSIGGSKLTQPLTVLYTAILLYLAKSRQYFQQHTAVRIVKSGIVSKTDIEHTLNDIDTAQLNLDRYIPLADAERLGVVDSRIEKLTVLLRDIDGPVQCLTSQVQTFKDHLNISERTRILTWLSSEPYLAHHRQSKRGFLLGTGQWLLSNTVFRRWLDDSASSLLWLHGMSGSGKSKLVSLVIEKMYEDHEKGVAVRPVHFYCSRNNQEPMRSDPQAILASLARQLSSLGPGAPILPPSIAIYRQREDEGFASGDLSTDESIELIVKLTAFYPVTTIVLDALDECDSETRYLILAAFQEILTRSSGLVRIFVSSREDGDLICGLQEYPSLKVSSNKNSRDIEAFVRAEVERLVDHNRLLRNSRAKSELKKLITDSLIQGAAGMFRWVSMQIEALCAMKSDGDIRSRLGRLPSKLAALYQDIYDNLLVGSHDHGHSLIRNIFSWLLCARRALKSQQFYAAVAQNLVSYPEDLRKDAILDLCCNFVEYDESLDIFRFAHPSVREFLELLPDYSYRSINAVAAESCLVSISTHATSARTQQFLREVYGAPQDILESPWDSRDLAAFDKYAIRYGIAHCQSAEQERSQGPLKKIFRHFLSDVGEKFDVSPLSLWIQKFPQDILKYNIRRALFSGRDGALETANTASNRGLFMACAFHFPEIITEPLRIPSREDSVMAVSLAILANDHIVVKVLFETKTLDKFIKGTLKPVLTILEVNHAHGQECLQILLDHSDSEAIDDEVLLWALQYHWSLLKDLPDRAGKDCIAPEVVLAANTWSHLGQVLQYVKVSTLATAQCALGHHQFCITLSRLFEACAGPLPLSSEILEAAARCNCHMVREQILLRPGVHANQTVVRTLMRQGYLETLDKVMHNNAHIRVTKWLLIDWIQALHEYDMHPLQLNIFLGRCKPTIHFTECMIRTSLANNWTGYVIRELLKHNSTFPVTEHLVKHVISALPDDVETVEVILGRQPRRKQELLKHAIAHSVSTEVLAVMLPETFLTEELLLEAVSAYPNNPDYVRLLLEHDENFRVLPNVLRRVALSLDSDVREASHAWHLTLAVMNTLCNRLIRDRTQKATLLTAAAPHTSGSESLFWCLLGRYDQGEVSVTDASLEPPPRMYETEEPPKARNWHDDQCFRKDLLAAAAARGKGGNEHALFERLTAWMANRVHTPDQSPKQEILDATLNGENAELTTLQLVKQIGFIPYGNEVLEEGIERCTLAILKLVLRYGRDIKITRSQMIRAMRNPCHGYVISQNIYARFPSLEPAADVLLAAIEEIAKSSTNYIVE